MPELDIIKSLNTEQQKAVISTDGASIILAGAGSGKTRVLVHKVLYLILEKNIDPSNILAVTFTNKAAGEMFERIQRLLESYKDKLVTKPTISTFHSLCARILRRSGHHIAVANNFIIYDTQDQQDAIKQVLQKLDITPKEIRPRSALGAISQNKNELIEPHAYQSFARGYFQEKVARIYPVYQKLLKENNALDFDDLLLEVIRLFKGASQILNYYQDIFQYILIDEYQDTNKAQYEITKLLSQKRKNICVVGDFSQSIYSFRGADYRNLNRFENDFPDLKIFSLSQNYRSTQKILSAATSVIKNNSSHPILTLWTENPSGNDITIHESDNEHSEIEYIITQIMQLKTSNFSFKDSAILYRTNAQSRTIEEVLLHHGIPYILVGGVRFYDRREVKDVLAMLTFLANPKDTVANSRIEKIGKRRSEKFFAYSDLFSRKTPTLKSEKKGIFREKKMPWALAQGDSFLNDNLIDKKTTIEILDEVLIASDYLSLFDENVPEERARLENIKELRSVALEFSNLIQFLENVSLVEQESISNNKTIGIRSTFPKTTNEERPDAITLMTLHQAKGLEFKFVAIVGMEEGIFPHSQSLFDESEIEEERRLCYVGMTRAKEILCLTYSRRRLLYGQRSNNMVSRFIFELPPEILDKSMLKNNTYRNDAFIGARFKTNSWDEEPF